MNNKIKRIIAIALTINVFSLVEPAKYLIMTTEAYASESTSVYLKNLSLSKSDIDFSQDTFYYDVKVDKDVNEMKITAKPKSSDATVTIDDDPVDENDNYKKTVSIEQGNNIVKIKVTNDEEDKIYTLNILCGEALQDNIYLNNINLSNGNINFSKEITDYNINVKESIDKITIGAIPEEDMHEVIIDGAKANKEDEYKQTVDLNKGMNPILIKVKNKDNDQRTYTLNITRENGLDTNENQDDIYLDYIKCSDGVININQNDTTYELNLKDNVEQTDITAEPERGEYTVRINDKIVEDVDKHKDKLTLKPGRNVITIKVQDQSTNKQRTYTLYLNRGTVTGSQSNISNTLNTTSTNNNVSVEYNRWVQTNDKWQYNDSIGNPIKNNWFNDRNTGKWYFLGSDGFMQTGWILAGGKYYYLNSDGSMATNTTISGYKVGNDGAWVK